jgi:hypothetical protein
MDFKEKVRRDLNDIGVDVTLNNTVDDLFTKKYLQLNEPIKIEIDNLPKKLSFLNFNELEKDDQEMFAGNFFVDVSSGEYAQGAVRVYFDSPTDLTVKEGTGFATDNDLRFSAIKDTQITSTEMANYSEGMYYYHELEVIAEEKSDEYNIDPKAITTCLNPIIESRAVQISNPYGFNNGAGVEPPEKTYERVQDSISVRNLSNEPAIKSVLKNKFASTIINIFPIRTGDELMRREIEVINNKEYRVGNMHDIWVENNDLAEYEFDITKTEDPTVNFGFSIGDLGTEMFENGHTYTAKNSQGEPIDMVIVRALEVSALTSDGEVTGTINGVDFIQSLFTENSVRQKSILDFTGTTYENVVSDIRIRALASPAIPQMQKFINDPKNRMPVGDPLIRHFELFPLYGIIYYRGEIEELELQEKINYFIKYYHYNETRASSEYSNYGEPMRRIFEVSDLISTLYAENVEKVKLPMTLELDTPYITLDNPISFNSNYDTYVDLPYFKILYNTETVTDGITVFKRNIDYQIDYQEGRIMVFSNGNMMDSSAYNISFSCQSPNGIGSTDEYIPIEDEYKILPYQTMVPKVSVAKEEGV